MCGIAGIVSLDLETPVEESRLKRMRDTLTHRGPDDAGVWVDGPVGLAHRRLAIVDVAGGRQPMSNEDGSAWIVFNGEIYNHADLRPGLEVRGHRYRTRSDTETIIHLYEDEAERAVEHLHGMFAFAIWDRRRRILLLARDRVGIKPLYYARTHSEFLFASEIKAILAAGVRPELNAAALPEFLATRFVAGEETLFRDIRRLLPGHTLTSSGRRTISRRYWQLGAPGSRATGSFKAEATELRDRLSSAVRRHLMSDVPLGLFLSGGLDSSALAVLTAGMTDEPLRTFSVGFAEAEANELPYARRVAEQIGAEHREVVVSPDEYFDVLPQLIWHEDEPLAFTSSVPLHFVSKLASGHVKVVLTGEGADELFYGYNRYPVTLWNSRLGGPYWAMTSSDVRATVRNTIARLPPNIRRYAARTFLALESGERSLFFENFAVFGEAAQRNLLTPSTIERRDPYQVLLRYHSEGQGGILDRLGYCDFHGYLHELLMKQDQMSMSASVESRVPFLDDDLVEYVSTMPAGFKLRGWTTKAVLREAIRGLVPNEILTRKKMGFPVPLGRWLREGFWPVVEEFVLGGRAQERGLFNAATVRRVAAEHQAGTADHGDRLWLLINLEIWQRIFCEDDHPARVMRLVRRGKSVSYAGVVGEGRGPVAVKHGRTASDVPHVIGAGATAPGGARHYPRVGG